MSAPTIKSAGVSECFAIEGVLEKVEGQYFLDPNPGTSGPLFQIAEEDVLGHWETGTEAAYPGGRLRPLRRIHLRQGATGIRLEHVRLDEVLTAARTEVPQRPGCCEDSCVILVPWEEESRLPVE
jgi:hypothetical protein